jgi:hypothetical protein
MAKTVDDAISLGRPHADRTAVEPEPAPVKAKWKTSRNHHAADARCRAAPGLRIRFITHDVLRKTALMPTK